MGLAFVLDALPSATTPADAAATGSYKLSVPVLHSSGMPDATTAPIPLPPGPPPFPGTAPIPTGTVPTGLTSCRVTNVVDGDTIDVADCADAGRVRLILIDTPEVFGGTECLGKEASAYTTAALEGRTVELERDVSNRDSFGRYLRYVWIGGELFNEQIVRDGYALLATYPPDVKYVDTIRAAQEEAFAAERGLWSPSVCSAPSAPAVLPPAPPAASPTAPGDGNCDPSYPSVCIPSPPPDLDCAEIPHRNFPVIGADPHRFDGDNDGLGCEGP